ncbi:sterigmatocystin biosynthesis fatty acid synthase subunit beta, partial [Podospora appendiculata]
INTSSLPGSLLAAAEAGDASLAFIFGGQGSSNAQCVDQAAELYALYPALLEPLVSSIDSLFANLSTSLPELDIFFLGREISIRTWLEEPSSRPEKAFIASAAVSFPLIGLLDLMQYCIIGKTLGKTPKQLRQLLAGLTGHSQGIVVAAALARSDCNSWADFDRIAAWAVELLFWIGFESHAGAPQASLPPAAISESVEKGYGVPSHMLSVRGVQLPQLDKAVEAFNHNLNQVIPAQQHHLHVALINGPSSYVVAGAPRFLFGLAQRLTDGQSNRDQSRVPFSQRKPTVHCHFLPISAPFHTPHLAEPAQRVKDRFSSASHSSPYRAAMRPTVGDLDVALFHTETGKDVRETFPTTASLVDVVVDAIATKRLDWPSSLQMTSSRTPVSHMIVLGNGRLSTLVHQTVDGLGIRVIDGTSIPSPVEADTITIGSRSEIFDKTLSPWQLRPQTWRDRFRPRIHKHFRDFNSDFTRLNRILNAPPVMVAGMTPTTVHPDFVAAVVQAGYHVELAGGGYFTEAEMSAAVDALTAQLPAGRCITVNLIYASPVAMGWQIPLLQTLIRRGAPIEGLTIAAGVPSPDVVAGYIRTLGASTTNAGGLRHMSFKPGSAAGIREVISIARSHPAFPIILQWTGGRGGGHHSAEDFHEPLLETYSEMRRCENLYLVVGSGFGDGAGMLPYFTGEWARRFGRADMPVDGVLMGSRLMVAKEAHTSPQAKALILATPGVPDAQWESSYTPAGHVLTVVSEMGQPIHKIATRAVKLWKNLDDTVFSLPRAERKAALLKRKEEIIGRLNADSHRPWFGLDARGKTVDLEDMTYAEVLARLVQLQYVRHQQRWVHPSNLELFREFAVRVVERLSLGGPLPSGSRANNPLKLDFASDSPYALLVKINAACPEAGSQVLHPEDARVFLHLCRARGRKPVSFILDLDDDFEHWFKKDSLWQSEDVDAVYGQDAQRVCVLQSPVSLAYSTRADQTAGEILDDIQHELGALIEAQHVSIRGWRNPASTSSSSSYWVTDGMPPSHAAAAAGVQIDRTRSHLVLRPLVDDLDPDAWLTLLKDQITSPALSAVLSEASIYQAHCSTPGVPIQPNCFRQIFAPRVGVSVHVHVCEEELLLVHDGDRHSKTAVLVRVSTDAFSSSSSSSGGGNTNPTQLMLDWRYDAKTRRLLDTMAPDDRNQRVQRFFGQLWLPTSPPPQVTPTETPSESLPLYTALQSHRSPPLSIHLAPEVYSTLQASISQAFDTASPTVPRLTHGTPIALEASVIAAWDALMAPLVLPALKGDLLRLVHRSIGVRLAPDAAPLTVGENLTCSSRVTAVTIEPSGKSIKVAVDVFRPDNANAKALTILGEFFIRGKFADWADSFRDEDTEYEVFIANEIDEAVLRDREWFTLNPDMGVTTTSLVGKTLVFKLHSHTLFRDATSLAHVTTTGTVEQKTWNGARNPIGSVFFTQTSLPRDPVVDFLQRKGTAVAGGLVKVPLKMPGWTGEAERIVTAPSQRQSKLYAAVSGDLNPIHTSPVFAALAEIPGGSTIVHGMYTVAVCRQVVEELCGLGSAEQRGRLRAFSADLVGMVRPGDVLRVGVVHEAMVGGRMVVEVIARLASTGEVVVKGEAEVEQPTTAYVFTGQGSQSPGMGMALYKSSPVAQKIWDEMDAVLMDQFGWSIMHIVNDNPTELTIHFGGPQGQKVLNNYLAMTVEIPVPGADSTLTKRQPLIPDITPDSESYTFRDSRGLVHATQFAQPAIMILQKATVEHLAAEGLLQQGAVFAGHSLGEWGAISSMAGFLQFSQTMTIGFYRGLLMHFAVPRDADGQTGYSMVAVNPTRAGKGFDDAALRTVVNHIAHASGRLMEIVNFNVEAEQYVCAGHVRNISVLTQILNTLPSPSSLQTFLTSPTAQSRTSTLLGQQIASAILASESLPLTTVLPRGRATIPLSAIDIPFHSNILRPGIAAFRRILEARIRAEDFRPELAVGKWVTNVLGKEFSLDQAYLKEAADVTGSEVLREIVDVVDREGVH